MVIDIHERVEIGPGRRGAEDARQFGEDRLKGAVPLEGADDLPGRIFHRLVRRVKLLSRLPRVLRLQKAVKLFPCVRDRGAGAAEHGGGLLVVGAGMACQIQRQQRHIAVMGGDQGVRGGGRYAVFSFFLGHGALLRNLLKNCLHC